MTQTKFEQEVGFQLQKIDTVLFTAQITDLSSDLIRSVAADMRKVANELETICNVFDTETQK